MAVRVPAQALEIIRRELDISVRDEPDLASTADGVLIARHENGFQHTVIPMPVAPQSAIRIWDGKCGQQPITWEVFSP